MAEDVSLRDHFDAILTEKDRAVEMASEEREKAADALRVALVRTIDEGDSRLREHIENQVQQIRDALDSAEKLEVERIAAVLSALTERITAGEKAVEAAFKASEQAIDKAEVNAEKWRDNANEWRGQSADRERTQAEQIATLTQSFMPRELAESQLEALRKQMSTNQDRLNTQTGERTGLSDSRTTLLGVLIVLATIAAVISPHIR